MVPFNRRPVLDVRAARSSSSATSQSATATGPRVATTLIAAVLAAIGWSIARLFVPDRFVSLVAFCAAWIALYPVARFYAGGTLWGHLGGGMVIVLVWLLVLFLG